MATSPWRCRPPPGQRFGYPYRRPRTSLNIDNESTHSSDATVALGGPETVAHPEDSVYDNQDRLTALT